jgi:hypothetical protein
MSSFSGLMNEKAKPRCEKSDPFLKLNQAYNDAGLAITRFSPVSKLVQTCLTLVLVGSDGPAKSLLD